MKNLRFTNQFLVYIVVFTVNIFASGPAENKSGDNRNIEMFRGNQSHSGNYNAPAALTFPERKFIFRTKGAIRSTPVIYGDNIFFGCSDGYLYNLNKYTGTEVWKFKTGGNVASSPAYTDGIIYFASRDNNVYAISAVDGKLAWKFNMGKELDLHWGFDIYLSSPLIVQQDIFIGSGDGNLYKLNAATGKLIWNFETKSRIRSTPAYSNGLVYFGDMTGTFYAVDAESGKTKWTYNTIGYSLDNSKFGFDRKSIVSSPAVSGNKVIFGCRDGFLYSLNAQTGELLWKYDHQISWIISSPAVSNGRVFVGSSDGRFIQAVDLNSGKEIWRVNAKSIVWTSGCVSDSTIYFGDSDGGLYALNSADGKILFHYHVNGGILSSPIIDKSTLYVGTDNNKFYSLQSMTHLINNSPLHKAVYWMDFKEYSYFTKEAVEVIKKQLTNEGYELLNGEGLEKFMANYSGSDQQSVIVFLTVKIPHSVFNGSLRVDPLRQYLNSGGRIVLTGGPNPTSFIIDEKTDSLIDVDFNIPEKALGIKYNGHYFVEAHGGFYPCTATETGSKWGLPESFVGSFGIDPSQVGTILAVDDYGKAVAWIKSYSGKANSGIIQICVDKDGTDALSIIKSAAEHPY